MDLKCKKTVCAYNKNFACLKDSIRIAKNCECASFVKSKNIDEKNICDASKHMFESAPEVHPYRHSRDLEIRCNADCLFNLQHNCNANGICVDAIKNEPVCNTFLKR